MSDNTTRTIEAGHNDMSLAEFKINVDTRTGAVSVLLPKLSTLYAYIQNQYGSFSAYNGIRFADIYDMAGTHNITFIAQDGDEINGSANVVLSTNGVLGIITPISDTDWLLTTNVVAGGGGGAFTSYADFFGLTTGTGNGGANDYVATIPVSTGVINQGVPFPRISVNVGTAFSQPTARKDSVQISTIGTYKVGFAVSVTEAGQLNIETSIDGGASWLSVSPTSDGNLFGRATGTSQIIGTSYITTTVINQLIRVANAVGNATALTVTVSAGGTHASSAHLIIEKIA